MALIAKFRKHEQKIVIFGPICPIMSTLKRAEARADLGIISYYWSAHVILISHILNPSAHFVILL